MQQNTKVTAIVSPKHSKQLAFWESIIDIDDGPAEYLDAGTKVKVLDLKVVYGGIHGDKEYCKVECSPHGAGYVLKEGLSLV